MIKFILRIFLTGSALFFVLQEFPGISLDTSTVSYEIAFLITFVGAVIIEIAIFPILKLITIPFNILTFGIASIILHVILFYLLANLVSVLVISNFVPVLMLVILVSVINFCFK